MNLNYGLVHDILDLHGYRIREMQEPQVIGYFNPAMIQALEDIINKEFLLSDRSGKAMYNIWLLNENRRITCLFAGGENVVLEEQIAEALENHNRYHKTTYTRKDVSVVREDPDDTIELAKAKWRIDFLLRTLDRMETEIVGLQLNLKSANEHLMNVSPAVLSGAKCVAEEVLQKVNGHFARLHFISPNTPLVQLTRDDKEELLRSYVLPLGAPVSVSAVPVSGIESEIKSYERLRYLEQAIHKRSDCLAFSFARELILSATAAYGRPVIDTHGEEGPRSITFEWQRMFWLFKSDGDEISVVINDNAKKTLTFFRKDFKSFIDDYTCVPAGLPVVENQSEFNSVAPVSVETVYAPGLVAKSM